MKGEVQFVGQVLEIGQGYFVGVKLDEKEGHHDGSVKGVQYFQCEEGYGIFLRPVKVKVGYYPKPIDEEDIDEI